MTPRRPRLLSVLIPTLHERAESLGRLVAGLHAQAERHGLREAVEVLRLPDGGEAPIGRKRNRLLDQARGEFVAFVDDDDEISDDYLPLICAAIRDHPGIDCVGIRGVVTFRGRSPRPFVHSLRYQDYRTRRGTLLRPPDHLNPIRRAIAGRYRFAEIRYGEDIDWALRISRAGALRREHHLDAVIYHYRSRRPATYQWLVERTEPLRHALGLRYSSWVRLRWGPAGGSGRARGHPSP